MKSTKPKAPVMIPVEKLVPFDGHPYKVLDDDSMNDLTESVQDNGIMEPLTVRPLEDTDNYEIISGHRRYHAAKKAGLRDVPAFIRAVSRDEAAIMLVDSNLHRERILPSEKAFAYKLKAEALNHQGKREITSGQLVPKSDDNRATAQIGEQTGESYKTVQRYIRLTNLIPELLDMMDEGMIAFSVGVELSFLNDERQYDVLNACEENDNTPSYAQAVRMHKAYTAGELDRDGIDAIMCEEKANQREKVTIPLDRLKGKIPGSYTVQQQQDYIVKAVDHYHRYLQYQREAR
ncbi:MAG: ParB/RepB/Spo0J family partition protein [Clostridia bacterium]|nr:ParB/RepB/Spo0J family partition protein [Clostridia bacterium]